MFETNDRGRLLGSPFFPPQEGAHHWAYVTVTSNSEWFSVIHETFYDGSWHAQQILLPSPPYLLGLTSRNNKEERIREIQLISPPWLNGSGAWKMDPLSEVRISGKHYCYELVDGTLYPSELMGKETSVLWRVRGDT